MSNIILNATRRNGVPMSERCKEKVYKRDTYRYSGRGPTGFEMHYREERCGRRATHGEYCWQHAKAGAVSSLPVPQDASTVATPAAGDDRTAVPGSEMKESGTEPKKGPAADTIGERGEDR